MMHTLYIYVLRLYVYVYVWRTPDGSAIDVHFTGTVSRNGPSKAIMVFNFYLIFFYIFFFSSRPWDRQYV
jgi:hypothetical protein